MKILKQNFYNRDSLIVAPKLLGKILVRKLDDQIISGRIVKVEAYLAFIDEAAHSSNGKTKRNEPLFKQGGHAYVHRIHMQNCLDVVTGAIDIPHSVLIRALEPLKGVELMKKFRNKDKLKDLTSGPGKLTQALKITKEFDGIDITSTKSPLYIIDDGFMLEAIVIGKRVGLSKAKEKDFRFYVKDNPFVSKK